MNDLEKMQKEFEQKMKIAQIENELNRDLEREGVRASIFQSRGGVYSLTFYGGKSATDQLTPRNLGTIMRYFPVTEQSKIQSTRGVLEQMNYVMVVHRYDHLPYTELEVRWRSNEFEIWATMHIDDFIEDDDIAQFFTTRYRETETRCERVGGRTFVINPQRLVYYSFLMGSVIKFNGGHDYQSEGWVGEEFAKVCIAKSLKED